LASVSAHLKNVFSLRVNKMGYKKKPQKSQPQRSFVILGFRNNKLYAHQNHFEGNLYTSTNGNIYGATSTAAIVESGEQESIE
jgi:hypothetical protein